MTTPLHPAPQCCQSIEPGGTDQPACAGRRTLIKATVAGVFLGLQADLQHALAAEAQELRPSRGDRLASVDASGTPAALRVADIVAGSKPVHAFPLDPASGTLRDGSRFNKVLLMRFDLASLDEETRARSADGVLAFSAICTHEGCDVTEYVPEEKALMCFCHFSKFAPCEAGRVLGGPAPRNLPYLPLRNNAGELEVIGAFSAAPGAKKVR